MTLAPLLFRLVKTGGRSSSGRICSYHRGGGSKRYSRLLNYNHPSLLPFPFFVIRVERDPARSVPILLVGYSSGFVAFILKPFGLEPGKVAGYSSTLFFPFSGFSFPLQLFPTGSRLHNLSFHSGSTAQLIRSAGAAGRVMKQDRLKTLIQLPSGELRYFPSSSVATYGELDGGRAKFGRLKKAGQARWLGRRPVVRGVAMNPVDHPHGGGQGKTSGGRPSVSPWGFYTKGRKTRSSRNPSSNYIFLSRSKKKQ